MDVVLSTVGLVVLSPCFVVIAAYIRCVSPGPVFFRQSRVGGEGKQFTIIKFRTMHPDNDASAHRQYVGQLANSDRPLKKIDDISRLIPLGKLLRRSSVDELPQLINIFLGEMSLVGPRPDVLDFDDYTPTQQRRFQVMPGLTGLWQVSGKNRLTFEKMIALDLTYVRKRSLLFDLKILVRTLPMLVGLNR
ncbi:MAG: sugar transferase [Planctomycetales bacterium]|nr:sugar transferase [Planctomycetales bacterium]